MGDVVEIADLGTATFQGYERCTKKGDVVPAPAIRTAFERKWGREPRMVVNGGTIWLAGPVTDGEIKERTGRAF
jgi:hypothetical protein